MLWLWACTCPRFSEIRIEGGTPGAIARIEAALADFQGWSGREGVCVGRISVEAALPGVEALFLKEQRRIRLEEGDPELYRSTLHELCHAIDSVEELSVRSSSLFQDVPASALYPDGQARRRESFARHCEQGARDLGLQRRLMSCGEPALAADDWVQEMVYPLAPQLPMDPLPALGWERVPLSLPVGDRLLDVVGWGESVVLLLSHWAALTENPGPLYLLRLDPLSGRAFPLPMPRATDASLQPGLPPRLWVSDPEGTLSYPLDQLPQPEALSLPLWPIPPEAFFSSRNLYVVEDTKSWKRSLENEKEEPLPAGAQAFGEEEWLEPGAWVRGGRRSPLPVGVEELWVEGEGRLLGLRARKGTYILHYDPNSQRIGMPADFCHPLPAHILMFQGEEGTMGLFQDPESLEVSLWRR